jgi:hypothetical protein
MALLSSVLISFAQEQVTLTTYYPAPYGAYANMSVTGQLKMWGVDASGAQDQPGIWLAPPHGGNANPISISPYNFSASCGLRIIFYSTGGNSEIIWLGHVASGTFRGLSLKGDDSATLTGDVIIGGQLNTHRVYINENAAFCSDPLDATMLSVYTGGTSKYPYVDKNW